jgi:hypothetical protein
MASMALGGLQSVGAILSRPLAFSGRGQASRTASGHFSLCGIHVWHTFEMTKACFVDPFPGPDHSDWPAGGALHPTMLLSIMGVLFGALPIPLVYGREAPRRPLSFPLGKLPEKRAGTPSGHAGPQCRTLAFQVCTAGQHPIWARADSPFTTWTEGASHAD